MGHLKDVQNGTLQPDFAQELVDALWLKYSEWVWTISANTADYFAGYNQFQNLTVGGKTRSGQDGTNTVTFMAMKATEECKTYQPGLSVRLQADCRGNLWMRSRILSAPAQLSGWEQLAAQEYGIKVTSYK